MTGVIRAPRPERGYFDLKNETARDARLSYRARGVLVRLLSNADGFRMTADDLAREGKEGRTAVLSAFRELRAVGYMRTLKMQDAGGRWSTQTYVYDEAQDQSTGVGKPYFGLPDPGSPDAGSPDVGQPDPIKKHHLSKTNKKTTTKTSGGGDEKNCEKNKTPTTAATEAGAGEGDRGTTDTGSLADFLAAAGQPAALVGREGDLASDLGNASAAQAKLAGAALRAVLDAGKAEDVIAYARGLCRRAAAGLLTKPATIERMEEAARGKVLAARRAALHGRIVQAVGSGRWYEVRGGIAVALDGSGNHPVDNQFLAAIERGELVLEQRAAGEAA